MLSDARRATAQPRCRAPTRFAPCFRQQTAQRCVCALSCGSVPLAAAGVARFDFAALPAGRMRAGIAYGPHPRQALDVFLPEGEAKGLVVFVHGGYWRAYDRGHWSPGRDREYDRERDIDRAASRERERPRGHMHDRERPPAKDRDRDRRPQCPTRRPWRSGC